ncbi:MAG: orotidine-5'-phosphate decarboxylase [Spirochaetaceae bacterium]|jgi:orotidine-5'-phosphate decarboxylase|nr:orotidine-5'-phosphate decarboxylase [Spirochaetaceae bacterium]
MNPLLQIDALVASVRQKGPVCIGLDTSPKYVPTAFRVKAVNDENQSDVNAAHAASVLAYNKALIDATWDVAACFKVQIAYYEALGLAGLHTYAETLKYLHAQKALVIADVKRGDIADTAMQYTRAHFSGDFEADFVTLNPYMGMDSLNPWLAAAEETGKGAFVLMRTSNPGAADFEYLLTANDATHVCVDHANSLSLYQVVGDRLAELADKYQGESGFGIFGAVVGCTANDEAAEIRERYPQLFFLIPGYGAQGGGAETAAILLGKGILKEACGGVVNASRSIICAGSPEAAREAAIKMRDNIQAAING